MTLARIAPALLLISSLWGQGATYPRNQPNLPNGPVVLDPNGNATFPGTVSVLGPNGALSTTVTASQGVSAPNVLPGLWNPSLLLEAYDVWSAVVGSTISDLGPLGNNATNHGATHNANGTFTCNGSSQYISLPAAAGNGDFTAIAIAKPNDNGTGSLWTETNSGDAGNTLLELATFGDSAIRDSGLTGNYPVMPSPDPRYAYHVWVLQRSGSTGTGMQPDTGYSNSLSLGAISTVATDLGTLCARDKSSSRDLFWGGSIASFAVYSGALSSAQIISAASAMSARVSQKAVMATSPIDMVSLAAGPVWVPQGVVLSPTLPAEGVATLEISALWSTSGCSQIASPCMRAWYQTNSDLWYAESADGKGNFHKVGTAVVANHIHGRVYQVDSTHYLYVGMSLSTNKFDVYTSSDGLSWSLAKAGAIGAGTTGTWSEQGVFNPRVAWDAQASMFRMIFAGSSAAGGYKLGTASSPDGITWAQNPNNPVTATGPSSPWFGYINNAWWMWSQDGSLPTDIYRYVASSASFDGWYQHYPTTISYPRAAPDEGPPPSSTGQVADPHLVQVPWGQVYQYYTATMDGSGGDPSFAVKLAIYNGTLSQLVTTAEGRTASTP